MSKNDSWKNKYGEVKNGVLKSFIVYEDKWDTGNVGALSGPNGRCCIGFLALACGVKEDNLKDAAVIGDLKIQDQLKCLEEEELPTKDSSVDAFGFAYECNDMAEGERVKHLDGGSFTQSKSLMTPTIRKRLLRKFFKEEFDVKLTFKAKEPK